MHNLHSLLIFSNHPLRLIIAHRGCRKILELIVKKAIAFHKQRKKDLYRKSDLLHAASFVDLCLKSLQDQLEEFLFLMVTERGNRYRYHWNLEVSKTQLKHVQQFIQTVYVKFLEFTEENDHDIIGKLML